MITKLGKEKSFIKKHPYLTTGLAAGTAVGLGIGAPKLLKHLKTKAALKSLRDAYHSDVMSRMGERINKNLDKAQEIIDRVKTYEYV